LAKNTYCLNIVVVVVDNLSISFPSISWSSIQYDAKIQQCNTGSPTLTHRHALLPKPQFN